MAFTHRFRNSAAPVLALVKRRSIGGFTLIEVLVVVAIIALLISVLLPSLGRARDQARAIVCATNLRTCGQGVFFYLQANSDVYCGPNWSSLIHKYVQRASKKGPDGAGFVDFYLCSGDPIYHKGSSVAYEANGDCLRYVYDLSYGINDSMLFKEDTSKLDKILTTTVNYVAGWSLFEAVSEFGCDGVRQYSHLGMRKGASIKQPNRIVMLFDSNDDDMSVGIWTYDQQTHNNAKIQVHHKTGNNFLYADGHTEFKKDLPGAYQHGLPPFPWAWVPLEGWKITRQTNKYNPYGQDYSKF
jgi:prepilin-type N-terminal cleavage/methylation domain-containing protein/prepilin-type processing-associated H-X9-DG protein